MEMDTKTHHYNLLASITRQISDEIGNLKVLKGRLAARLDPVDLSKNKDMYEIFQAMEQKGLIDVGDYVYLKSVLKDGYDKVLKMVEETERKIRGDPDGQDDKGKDTTGLDNEDKKQGVDSSKSDVSSRKRRRSSENDGGSGSGSSATRQETKPESNSGATRGENFRKMEESALPFVDIRTLVNEGVDNQIGCIYIPENSNVEGSQGTGFRVGTNLVMSAYHVFQPYLDNVWKKIAQIVLDQIDENKNSSTEEYVSSLRHFFGGKTIEHVNDKQKLTQMFLDYWRNSTSPSRTIDHLIKHFEKKKHSDLPSEVRALRDELSKGGEITFGKLMKDGGKTLKLDLNSPYYSSHDDIILVKLAEDTNIPQPFVLEKSLSPSMHLLGHPDNKVLQFDSGCKVYKYADENNLETDITEAKDYCISKCNDDNSKREIAADYNQILGGFKNGKYVVFHSSRSIAHGASGCPGIVVVDGKPKVQMMLQRGHPGIVYRAFSKKELENIPAKCLFESGLSMKKVYDLLSSEEMKSIRDDIFSSTG